MSAPDVAHFGTHFASAYFLPNSIMHRALPPPMPPSQPLTSAAAQHFVGFVETTTDALRLIMAARQGIIPRITRRLNDSERRSMIRSGAVFVFCVEESGIKRWTEGLAWSPSRIVGNFLVYREVTERNSSRGAERGPVTPGTSTFHIAPSGSSTTSSSSRYRSRPETSATRSLDASGTLRANGLIKKTITVKVDGTDHHLVSYYRDEDVRLGHLPRPTTRPDIMALTIPPEMVRGTNFRHPPHIEIDSDGRARIYDAEEADSLRRQHDRASSVASTSRHSYSYTTPSLSLNTQHAPSLSLPSPTHSSVSHSSGEYDVSPYNRSPGSSEASFPPQGTYRWSASSSLTSPIDSPIHADRSASQFMRPTTPWQPPREYNSTPSSDAYPATYYQQGVQDRTQSPTTLPQTGNTYYGSSNPDGGLSLLPPRINSSWSLPPFAQGVSSVPAPSRYYGDGGAVTSNREPLSTPISQPAGPMYPQHSDSPYIAYRSSSRHGLYPRHGEGAYSSQRDDSAYDEDTL